jgi:hypothetical protein
MITITVIADLFQQPRVSVHFCRNEYDVQISEYSFDDVSEAYRFADRLSSEVESRSLKKLPGQRRRSRSKNSRANSPDTINRMAYLLMALHASASRWSTSPATEQKLTSLLLILGEIQSGPSKKNSLQLDLFSDDFRLLEVLYECTAEIAAELIATLMPYYSVREHEFVRQIRQSSQPKGPNINRLFGDHREALRWSLYSVFGRDARTTDTLRRLAENRIARIGDLIGLTERDAHQLARTDLKTWFELLRKLTALGFTFAPDDQSVPKYRKTRRYRPAAA